MSRAKNILLGRSIIRGVFSIVVFLVALPERRKPRLSGCDRSDVLDTRAVVARNYECLEFFDAHSLFHFDVKFLDLLKNFLEAAIHGDSSSHNTVVARAIEVHTKERAT